ncbi:MAG: hypothetical protein HW416_2274 [Chloroflexi bacterium]|nr:hypothetical protein [Chloroflexota bacterium]
MNNEQATVRGEENTMNRPWNHGAGGLKNRWRLLPLVAVLALGLVGIGANSVSAAAPKVPVKASVSGTVSPTGLSPTYVLAGTGTASHLGKVKSYKANVVITGGNPVTGPITDTLTETLTAANGDTLTILCQQVASLISPGVFHGVDQWTVIGGTGRFSGATGSGTGDTYIDLNVGTFTKALTGAITY